jgi:uncharacterized protein (TIGR03032 family)
MTASGSDTGPVVRDIRCAHSNSLPALLAQLRVSVLITTYQTGHLVLVAAREGRVAVTFHQFERATGVAIKPGTIAVCTRNEVWFLRSVPDIAAKLTPRGAHDACYLARATHFTGDIHAHEAAWVGGEFWVVNTRFSCLAALHPFYSFAPRWRPPFVSALCPEDRCHLNGLAVADGRPRYVTALGETDTAAGWRAVKHHGGCLVAVPDGHVLARGLSLPHSPRLVNGQLFLLQSGHGRLDVVDTQTGRVTAVAPLPGVTRGLAIHGGYAFVGLSRARPTLEGVPVVARRDELRCGVWVVDLRTGAVAAHLEFCTGVEELFDVRVLPGVTFPYVSGPAADRDTGNYLWAVPPE